MARHFTVGIAVFFLTLSALISSTTQTFASGSGILTPGQNAEASGIIDIQGSASHPAFRKWQIDLMLDGLPAAATFVALGDEPIDGPETLAILDTSLYPDGEHQLRLRVVHSNLNYDEYFTPIRIDNGLPKAASAKPVVEPEISRSAEETSEIASPDVALASRTVPTIIATAAKLGIASTRAKPVNEATARRTDNTHTLATRLDIPFDKTGRWIEVELATQTLRAWDADEIYLETEISSGKDWTPTVQGVFHVNRKIPSQRMVGPDYDLADVQAVMYFFSNYAIHGAYWHDDFGTRASHGCVNMREDEAIDLFEWAPMGTPVFVYE
jgi:lipoprotein-anchoring transpeptidase ErfK/SrfK